MQITALPVGVRLAPEQVIERRSQVPQALTPEQLGGIWQPRVESNVPMALAQRLGRMDEQISQLRQEIEDLKALLSASLQSDASRD